MPNVIIEHKDGRTYSTTREGYAQLYEPEGFKIIGEESDASFALVGVPEQKAPRRSPRAKRAKSTAAKQVAKVRAEAEADASPKPADVISPPHVEGEPS